MNALGKLDQSDPEIKTKIFECLIHKVEITKDGCKIHFFAGESEIERGLASAGPAPSFIGAEAGLNNLRSLGSRVLTNGGQVKQVDEHLPLSKMLVISVDFEAFPEPKSLMKVELAALKSDLKTNLKVAEYVGATEGFVRDQLYLRKKPRR